jgi:glycosyltransferase involved in cell wall biosynthesis
MKVLALAHQYSPVRNAGAETMLHGMLRALVRRGHDVHASLSMQVGDPYEHDGVKVWPRREGHKTDHFSHLPANLLVGHLDNAEVAAFLGHLNEIPVVLLNHNTFEISKKVMHFYGARVDLAVVNSQWMAEDFAAWHRAHDLPQPRTIIVRPLVEAADYAAEPGDRVTQVNLKQYAKDALSGNLGLSKGGETFWAIAKRMPGTKFLGVTGAYGVQAGGDLPNVEILGHVPAPRMRDEVYAHTRVLLVPSSYESWGRVASEAIACGIPVIAADTPGLRENLGDAGTFVDWQDVDGWVKALRTLQLPGPYAAARKRALARGAEHQQMRAEDEARWCDTAEQLGSRRGVLV